MINSLLAAVNVIGFVVVDLTTTNLMLHQFCRGQMIATMLFMLLAQVIAICFSG